MLPIEPRLKPLGATILHYADGETKTEFKRCHSYSGYIPYDLNDADAKSDASVEDAYEDVTTVVWPGTDEEHEVPSQSFNTDQVSVPQPASIGEKVIMGFGRALRKAVRDTCTLVTTDLIRNGLFWMEGGMFAIWLTSGKTQRGHDFYFERNVLLNICKHYR